MTVAERTSGSSASERPARNLTAPLAPARVRTWVVLLAGLTLAGALAASAPVRAENLIEIYELAKLNDADYRAAEATLRARLAADPIARARLRPQVDLGASATYIDNNPEASSSFDNEYTQSTVSLSLTQSLYRRDLLETLEQVDASVAQAQAEFDAATQDLILNVAERYFDILAARDNLTFARAEKDAIDRQLEQAQRRFEVGLIAITDVKEAQARFDQAVAQEIEADNGLAVSREALRVLVETEFGALAPLSAEAEPVQPDPPDIDAWVSTAEQQNLALRAARLAAEVARRQIEIERSGDYPTLDLVASHSYQDSDGGASEGESTTTSLGVRFNLPLYAGGGTRARTGQSRAEFDAARERAEKQRRSTLQQARSAYLSVLAGISGVRARAQALASTQAGAEATQAGFEVGTRTAVDVLIALQNTYLAERNYARARYDYILNMLRLRRAAGTLEQGNLEAINRWLR